MNDPTESIRRERLAEINHQPGSREALEAEVRRVLVGVAGGGLVWVLAGHLDVAAERQQADAIIRLALLESPQAPAKAEGKHFHADAKILGRQEMAQFMDEDHHPKNDDHSEQVGDYDVKHSSVNS